MRSFLYSSALLVVLATTGFAAPALGDRPPKWEYAELTYRTIPARAAGVDADGKEIPATPASMSIRWVTGAGEIDAKGWDELAEKLRFTGFKKNGSAAFLKIQILNHLGGEGWELMEQQGSSSTVLDPRDRGPGGLGRDREFPRASISVGSSTWLLKRRLP
jgi:hypothetical protein